MQSVMASLQEGCRLMSSVKTEHKSLLIKGNPGETLPRCGKLTSHTLHLSQNTYSLCTTSRWQRNLAFRVDVGEVKTKSAEENMNMSKLNERLLKAKGALVDKFCEGFDRAISQMQLLYPDANLEKLRYFKEIEDGRLVDPAD
ncbi:hypothetical protein E2542_SST10253 [Spatholobus suberectus]|nr:hypothetical protein E2542_SST10253 [Spatholobus suberectus]